MSLEHSPARQAAAYTIQEFCGSHRLSRSQLYSLWEQNKTAANPFGEGPHYFLVGNHSRRIGNEAAAIWRAAREAAAREAAAREAAAREQQTFEEA